jgi:predicted CXXCH cytochrome family protein
MKPTAVAPRSPVHKGKLASLLGVLNRGWIIALLPALLVGSVRVSAVENRGVEHPGSIHADDDCSSCHADKSKGKSVHSAMALPCIVCHLAQTQGDMTTLSLFMPKPKICSACHEQRASAREHRPVANGSCLDCHDAHSSNRRMLLRVSTDAPRK